MAPVGSDHEHKYTMSITLSVLNDLGINLYSNIPAVLAEVVANSWDADAKEVKIYLKDDHIVITDTGCGMDAEDVNNKYLRVGYRRRETEEGSKTPEGRDVMGRKGIGKLSLFSIANIIEVQSMKNGVKCGFIMNAKRIEERCKSKIDNSAIYYPDAINEEDITLDHKGTRIILRELKRSISHTPGALRKRLARRFSIIGEEYDFSVYIDDKPITVEDRDYFHKIQYLWYYGDDSKKFIGYCDKAKLKKDNPRDGTIKYDKDEFNVTGWIGTVELPSDLKGEDNENLNTIIVMVRDKLAQEDILAEFTEGGMYTKYIIGELHADFLDLDDRDDIATSSRQDIIKFDPRYVHLRQW